MKNTLLISVLLFVFSGVMMAQNHLFPTPSYMKYRKGEFVVTNQVKIKASEAYARKLAASLTDELKAEGALSQASNGVIELVLDKNLDLKKEGYILDITPEKVVLQSATEAGLFYAKQALLQLTRNTKGTIRACRIQNEPCYSWRGYMLDESRHFFGKEKVKQYLDVMASLHMNVLHWHLTDTDAWRIEIKRYPKLTQNGAYGNAHDPNAPALFYTQEDVKEIVAYAAERHIMVIPEFDMPGHASSICQSYPEISGGGEGRWKDFTFHPCKEVTFQFISNVFDELISLFPAPYIHIGGDEVHFGNQSWFTDPEIQQFIKDNKLQNEVGLEHYFIRRICKMLTAKGKITLGWDELVDAGVSPDEAVVMWWHHERKFQLVKALENGFKVIMTPRLPLYGDFNQHAQHTYGRTWQGFSPIEDIVNFPQPVIHLAQGYEDQLLGVHFSMWTERISTPKRLDFMTFPRLAAVAETGWTPAAKKSANQFMTKLPVFMQWLDKLGIYYFNPLDPASTPEPPTEKLWTGPRRTAKK